MYSTPGTYLSRVPMLLSVSSAVLALLVISVAGQTPQTFTVVLMSDLHYDPFYATSKAYICSDQSWSKLPYGTAGCDTTVSLLNSALDDVSKLAPTAVFVNGDWLRHKMDDLPSTDFETTLNFVAATVNISLGNAGAVPMVNWAVGNDDLVPSYTFNVSRLLQLRDFGTVMLKNNLITAAEKATFEDCGHFFRDIVSINLRVISLNTILWSTKITPPIASTELDPCGQLKFLRSSIDDAVAESRKVVIVGHIPPGLDVHGVMTSGFSASRMFWAARFQSAFIDIVREFNASIAFMLFGHSHMLSFIADVSLFPTVPIFIVPSIAPTYGNNPSYLIATVESVTGNILRLRHREFSLSATYWTNSADLAASFGIDIWNVTELARVATTFQNGGVIVSTGFTAADFLKEYSSNGNLQSLFLSGGKCDGICAKVLFCSMRHLNFADIQECAKIQTSVTSRQTSPATILFTVLSVLVFFVGLGMVVYRRHELTSVPPVGREAAILSATYIIRSSPRRGE